MTAIGVGDIVLFHGTVFEVEAQVVRIAAASAYTEAQYWLHGRGEWAALTWLHGTRDQLEIVLTAEAWKAGDGAEAESKTAACATA